MKIFRNFFYFGKYGKVWEGMGKCGKNSRLPLRSCLQYAVCCCPHSIRRRPPFKVMEDKPYRLRAATERNEAGLMRFI